MMKKRVCCVGVVALALSVLPAFAQNEEGAAEAPAETSTVELTNEKDKLSYVIGFQVGRGLQDLPELNLQILMKAIEDVRSNVAPPMTDEEMQQTLTTVMMQVQQEQQRKMEEEGNAREAGNQEYLAANAKKEGVKTTASGLQYRVITEGTGAAPTAADTVTVHYRGRLLDGTEFDSSYARNEPATFELGGVIPGWTEGLQLMKEGGKSELTIPADLAYGQPGRPGIPPNSVLVFEVELVKVEKAGNEVILEN